MGENFSRRRRFGWQAVLCLIGAVGWISPASSADPVTLAGTYCLVGVHEVGSCLRLLPDGKYEYFLAYGAYDETSEGAWRIEGHDVVLDSPAYDKRPGFAFKRLQRTASGGYGVVVESKAGQPVQGIDVSVTCDGKTSPVGITQMDGVGVPCTNPPTAVALSLAMFGLAPQSVDVSAHAGLEKGYVFEFEPGDLGKKRFAGERLRIANDALDMTFADTHIDELRGRPFHYVRGKE